MSAVTIAEIGAPHGVRGWVRLRSYADPARAIEQYREFAAVDAQRSVQLKVGEYGSSGKHLIARIEGVQTREQAEELKGLQLQVGVEKFARLPESEYYWYQIIGMEVRRIDGESLGRVESLIETGANDVMVVEAEEGEILIPWGAPVREVRLGEGVVLVDWDPEY